MGTVAAIVAGLVGLLALAVAVFAIYASTVRKARKRNFGRAAGAISATDPSLAAYLRDCYEAHGHDGIRAIVKLLGEDSVRAGKVENYRALKSDRLAALRGIAERRPTEVKLEDLNIFGIVSQFREPAAYGLSKRDIALIEDAVARGIVDETTGSLRRDGFAADLRRFAELLAPSAEAPARISQ